MIDALFGSKTRVKLLHLFLNNPGKSFYVREITRLIEEQINSVRRELANMLNVGIITSDSSDNKLYYGVNQRYEHYVALRAIFADQSMDANQAKQPVGSWESILTDIADARLIVAAGVLVKGSTSPVDLLIVGEVSVPQVKKSVAEIEKRAGRELNYSILTYEEFYYRLSVRDKFITEIVTGKHRVVVDPDQMLSKNEEK